MSRPVDISRSEAEMLVDLLEADGRPEALDLAGELRREFGMAPRRELWQYRLERPDP